MNSSANSRDTVSPGTAPTSPESVILDNVVYHNGGGAGLLGASVTPSASPQVFEGEQKFMGTVVNNNIYPPNLETVPKQPLQSFIGKQEFMKPVTNVNVAGSRHASRNVPVQLIEGDQEFFGPVLNINGRDPKWAADVLRSYIGGQKFHKAFENDHTVNLNNDNDSSETTGVTMQGTSIRVNGVDVTGGTRAVGQPELD